MKVRLEIDGEAFDVDVERTADGFLAVCEGQVFPLRVAETGQRVRLEGPEQAAVVDVTTDDRATIDGNEITFKLLAYEPGTALKKKGANGGTPVHAMMPGRLVRVLVKAGDAVEKGQPLFVLEAMKMQNELGSPESGRVAEVFASEGDVVEAGRRLARIDSGASRKA